MTPRQWPWHREPLRMEHTDGTPVTVSAPLPLEPEPDQRPPALQPFGLQAPQRVLMPVHSPMRFTLAEQREAEQHRREAQMALAVAYSASAAEWTLLLTTGSPVARAVLRLHQPEVCGDYADRITCTHCYDGGSGYEAAPSEWPCDTYWAVKESM